MSLIFFLKPKYGIEQKFDEWDTVPVEIDSKKKRRKRRRELEILRRQEEDELLFLKWILELDE